MPPSLSLCSLSISTLLVLLGGCTSGDTSMQQRSTVASVVKNSATTSSAAGAARIDFNQHIRPILNQNCTSCHGGVKSAGEISFVYRDVVSKVGKKSGNRVIVP